MQLSEEKMTIPAVRQVPPRPRLGNMVLTGLPTFNSTMLCGRAGTGKTVLAVEIAHQCERKTAWYTVDALDNDHRVFLRYLATSIGRQLPQMEVGQLVAFTEQAHLGDLEVAAEMLVYRLIELVETPLLIVIDDLHLVYDSPWMIPFFSRLLPLLPPKVHLLFAGRSLPPTPLWRMRSKQSLNVIDEIVLAFTYDETARLFEHYNVSLKSSEQSIEDILNQTRGRAAKIEEIAANLAGARHGWTAA